MRYKTGSNTDIALLRLRSKLRKVFLIIIINQLNKKERNTHKAPVSALTVLKTHLQVDFSKAIIIYEC